MEEGLHKIFRSYVIHQVKIKKKIVSLIDEYVKKRERITSLSSFSWGTSLISLCVKEKNYNALFHSTDSYNLTPYKFEKVERNWTTGVCCLIFLRDTPFDSGTLSIDFIRWFRNVSFFSSTGRCATFGKMKKLNEYSLRVSCQETVCYTLTASPPTLNFPCRFLEYGDSYKHKGLSLVNVGTIL